MSTTSRRSFIASLAATAGTLAAAPDRLLARLRPPPQGGGSDAAARVPRDARGLPVVPDGELQEDFWEKLRAEFLLPRDEAFFNTGTLGSSPKVVLDAVVEHMTHVERDLAHWDYKPDHENYFTGYYPETWLRDKLAALLGADTPEIALTQNATFGMNFIANGLELGPHDEVLVMEGAHPGGRGGWELRDKRYGPSVKPVHVPVPPESPDQLIEVYERATSPRTRVWAIPHLTSGTAIRFPVQAMAARARQRGIFTVVDGAQTVGHLAIDLHAMGCDAFFTSPHKWLLAPKGTGVLYVRQGALPQVWSTLASAAWDDWNDGAYRLMQYGTGNLSLLKGLEKAVDFHRTIGSQRVERRITGLADRLRQGLGAVPGARIHSPSHPELTSATTIWTLEGLTPAELQDALWDRAKIRVRNVGLGVRQCCHLYTLQSDVDRTLEQARRLARA